MKRIHEFWKKPVVKGVFIGWLIFGALFAGWLVTRDGTEDSYGLGNNMSGTPIRP